MEDTLKDPSKPILDDVGKKLLDASVGMLVPALAPEKSKD